MKSLVDRLNESLLNESTVLDFDMPDINKVEVILKAIKAANGKDNYPQTYLEEAVFDCIYNDEKVDATALYERWKKEYPNLYKAAVSANGTGALDTDSILMKIISFISMFYSIFEYSYDDESDYIRRFKSNKRGVSFGIEEEDVYHAFKFRGPNKLKDFAQVLAKYMDTKEG